MITVLSVFGTRPEAIKLAPVIAELRSREITTLTCATAQHRQMLDQVLEWFEIKPEFDLNLMDRNQELCQLAARVLGGVSDVLDQVRPDVVLVQGDTTTAMSAALATSYRGIRVVHVEAGLRTYDSRNPFPEELNRRIITATASTHFAPTARAARALRAEGIPKEAIYVTGNTVIDALRTTLRRQPAADFPDFGDRRIILVTAHRRESFGGPFESICHALRRLAVRNRDIEVVYPVHLNPNVRDPVIRILSGHTRIRLLDPLRYEQFVHLMARSHLILTDSGGIQEEAPFLGKPTLVMRDTTERPEAIEAGAARLVGTSESSVVESCERLLSDPLEYERMATAGSPFGDGQASRRIVDVLLGQFRQDDTFDFKEAQCTELATC